MYSLNNKAGLSIVYITFILLPTYMASVYGYETKLEMLCISLKKCHIEKRKHVDGVCLGLLYPSFNFSQHSSCMRIQVSIQLPVPTNTMSCKENKALVADKILSMAKLYFVNDKILSLTN